MGDPNADRLAAIEATLGVVGERVSVLSTEMGRSRERLHDLEGATRGLLELQRERVRSERAHARQTDRRLRLLTLIVGASGVATPVVFALLHT